MKHKYIYIFYIMVFFSAISWRITRAHPSLSEIKNVNISESEGQTIVSIDLSKPTRALPFLKSQENCIVLDFDKTMLSKDLKTRAFASRDVKLGYLSVLTEDKIPVSTKKAKAIKKVRGKFFLKPDCLASVKYSENKVILKLTEKETLLKAYKCPSNSLMHPKEKKYSPVVISLENAPFQPVVSEIAAQAGMGIKFTGKIPETLSMELQSEDPFDALCSIAVKTNMKFYRDGKTWYMEGENLVKK